MIKLMRGALAFAVLCSIQCGESSGSEHSHEGEDHDSHDDHEGHDHEGSEGEGHGEHDEHEGELRLSAAAIAASGIELGTLGRRALTGGAGLPAELRFDPLSTAHVSSPAPGRFSGVRVALGERVERGQILATVSSVTASESRANLNRARARLAAAEAALERQRALVGEGIGAARGLIEAEADFAGLRAEVRALSGQLRVLGSSAGGALTLRAPIAGVVVSIAATPGETVGVEQAVFTIADPTAISVYGQVPELAIARISNGLETTFRPHAFPELALAGRIQYIAPAIDPDTRSLTVRVELAELDPRLRSGMYGTLELVGDERHSLAVPTASVVTIEGASSVFIRGHEDGEFLPVPVQIGRRAGAFYELLGGLEEGAEIVIAGAFTLKGAMSTDQFATHEH